MGPGEDRCFFLRCYRNPYYGLANYLHQEDSKAPHFARANALRELPNLLHAADAAFDAHDPDAVDFAGSVTWFLNIFGLKREAERLTARAQAASSDQSTRDWFLAQCQRGEQLQASGRAVEAAHVFQAILSRLGEVPSYKRAFTLASLGRCIADSGQPDLAAARYREGIAVTEKLEQSDKVKRLTGALHTDLADVLMICGQYAEARREYEEGLKIDEELEDLQGRAVRLGQLGMLALREGKQEEAQARYQAALAISQQLREPEAEARCRYHLGMVLYEAQQWDEAERHYREAARIAEELDDLVHAALIWNELGLVNQHAGKPQAAEGWFRKAIEADRKSGNPIDLAVVLNNLADLLQTQPDRLSEARQLAEESLAIKKTVDPAAAEIWKTYELLEQIADKEAALTADSRRQAELHAEARGHRRLAREAWRNFPGSRQELQKHLPLIQATLMAAKDPNQQGDTANFLKSDSHSDWNKFVNAICRIVVGERDPEVLCVALNPVESMVVETILAALSDPSSLSDLLPPDHGPDSDVNI